MRQQDVFKKIGAILQELTEQYDYLKTQNEQVDDLELELFAANSHFLTDHLDILRKLNSNFLKAPVTPLPENDVFTTPEKEAEAQNEPLFQPYQQSREEVESAAVELLPTIDENSLSPDSDYDLEQVAEEEQTSEAESGFQFDFSPASIYNKAEHSTETSSEEVESIEERITPETPVTEEHLPNIYDQIAVNAAQPDDGSSAHRINMSPDTGHDHFGYIRATEPEVIKHELALDDADTYNDADNQVGHQETVADALAAIEITPNAESNSSENNTSSETEIFSQETVSEPEKPLTLNERIAAQSGVTPNTNSAPQPVKDLKAAITLNDKMLFVRDLFNGYSLAYSEAVEILNRFTNYDDADKFLTNNYVAKNNWDSKPGTKEKFYDLLKRRYV